MYLQKEEKKKEMKEQKETINGQGRNQKSHHSLKKTSDSSKDTAPSQC